MTPAQKAAKRRQLGIKSKRREPSAPTAPRGETVRQTQLTKTPLFPIRKWLKGQLYYGPYNTLQPSVGSIGVRQFSANGIYDPDITGTGHQPVGFDQMMALYEQYTVMRAHIKVTFLNAGSDPARVCVFLNPDTTTPTITSVMENGLIDTKLITGNGTDGGAHRIATIELTCDMPKYFGKTWNDVLGNSEMYGTIASNPVEQVYFSIAAWDPFGSAADVIVGYDVVISYDVMYWEPKKLASS